MALHLAVAALAALIVVLVTEEAALGRRWHLLPQRAALVRLASSGFGLLHFRFLPPCLVRPPLTDHALGFAVQASVGFYHVVVQREAFCFHVVRDLHFPYRSLEGCAQVVHAELVQQSGSLHLSALLELRFGHWFVVGAESVGHR